MSIWLVVWVVLMMFWLFGGGYRAYRGPDRDPVVFGTGTLIPWLCVAILGAAVFGGIPLVRF